MKVLTFVVLAIVAAALGVTLGTTSVVGHPLVGLLPAGAICVVLLIAWAIAPVAVEIEPGEVAVLRHLWPAFRIALDDIETAEAAPALRGLGTLRLFGSGGFFGSYGLFWNRKLGRFRCFATRIAPPGVLIRRKGGLPVLLTPDDVNGFLAALAGRGSGRGSGSGRGIPHGPLDQVP